jgi:hypothetical protein
MEHSVHLAIRPSTEVPNSSKPTAILMVFDEFREKVQKMSTMKNQKQGFSKMCSSSFAPHAVLGK